MERSAFLDVEIVDSIPCEAFNPKMAKNYLCCLGLNQPKIGSFRRSLSVSILTKLEALIQNNSRGHLRLVSEMFPKGSLCSVIPLPILSKFVSEGSAVLNFLARMILFWCCEVKLVLQTWPITQSQKEHIDGFFDNRNSSASETTYWRLLRAVI